MIIYRKTILNSLIKTLAAIFIGCTSHNYYSSEQPNRSMKEMVECVVTYIVTGEEKVQLILLNTDEEFNAFLVEFWKKRDPSPESQVNEYRDAYLERFQLANTSLGRWQSDRGRVFILYSKPEATFKTEDKERINSYD